MTNIIERARVLSQMITMGERISWGQDTAMIDEMADTIEAQAREIARLRGAVNDEDILVVIEEGVSDGWDSDCTNRSMAICVLNEIRRQGFQIVKRDEEEPAP